MRIHDNNIIYGVTEGVAWRVFDVDLKLISILSFSGYAYNSSVGREVGSRVTSNQLGQISIWPMRPGEEGVYSCEVAGIVDDTGRTKINLKTFGVFVGKKYH